MIRGILFDKDGTLLDFEATWRGFVEESIAAVAPHDLALRRRLGDLVGLDPDTRRFRAGSPVVSGSTAEVAALWAPHLPGRQAEDIAAEIDDRAAAAVLDAPTAAAPDLPGLLDGFRARGMARSWRRPLGRDSPHTRSSSGRSAARASSAWRCPIG